MQQDLVFFKKEGEEGVALTSTSANHIANLAKEFIQDIEARLNSMSFYSVEVALIGGTNTNTIQNGSDMQLLGSVGRLLNDVAQAKSLIAWLREGIKTKDALVKNILSFSIGDFCNLQDIDKPKEPEMGHILTEEEYYTSLPIKERNRYYELETEAAVIGSCVHPRGPLSNARKELSDKIQHPHMVQGIGRDALIYTYTPTVTVEELDTVFFELQKRHRETQAQLNAMKYNCEQAINESTNKANSEYEAAFKLYQTELSSLYASFQTWRAEKTQEYNKLKIVIPNSLLGIYNTISSLGK
jgi:hypothetical protein